MKREVTVPELGENIETAVVGSLLAAEGDSLQAGAPLLELESEKATLEIPAPFAGVVVSFSVKPGDTVRVGAPFVVMETADSVVTRQTEPEAMHPRPETMRTEPVPSDTVVATGASDSGRSVNMASAPSPAQRELPAKTTGSMETKSPIQAVEALPAAPSVRRLARELGVDIHRIRGSGSGGRISAEDVKGYVREAMRSGGERGLPVSDGWGQVPPMPDLSKWGAVHHETLSGLRRTIARNLTLSWNVIPHVTQFDEADITDLEAFRQASKKREEAAGVKLTITAFLVKVAALALLRYPEFNAALDLEKNELVHRDYVHMGVAVDTERGLLVPVIRDANRKGVREIARQLEELSRKAREKRLTQEEMEGAGFSLSNLGGPGTTHFTPVIRWPEAAILGVGRAKIRAEYREGSFVPRLVLPLSLSYDHRIVDGAGAARFLRWIAEVLENPANLLMD